MFLENVTRPKGWIKIWAINKDGKSTILADQHNALTINSKKIIAYVLGQQSGYAIDNIKVYKAGTLLATSPSLLISFPIGDNKVKFSARFNEASFNDTLDEVRLCSVIGGEFSTVDSLSITKADTIQLQIEWVLTIND